MCLHGSLVFAEGLDMFRLGAATTGGRVILLGNLSFTKEVCLDGCLGVEPRTVGIAFTENLCELGEGIILAEGHD
jgi:hypothetical protein